MKTNVIKTDYDYLTILHIQWHSNLNSYSSQMRYKIVVITFTLGGTLLKYLKTNRSITIFNSIKSVSSSLFASQQPLSGLCYFTQSPLVSYFLMLIWLLSLPPSEPALKCSDPQHYFLPKYCSIGYIFPLASLDLSKAFFLVTSGIGG